MPKNFLLLDSSGEKNKLIIDLCAALEKAGYNFVFLSSGEKKNGQTAGPAKKIYLGPSLKKAGLVLSLIILPWLILLNFYLAIKLLYYKLVKKIDGLICLGWKEKILFSPLAKLFNLSLVWLEFPNQNFNLINRLFFRWYKFNSRWAKIIVFNSRTKIKLQEAGLSTEKIKIIQPGIALKQYKYQDNIFSELAQAEQDHSRKKFFTLGTVLDLNQEQKVETLFHAIKKCISIIPNLQLIVIGEGTEKKNLAWMAKKLEIDNLVWFVGRPEHLRKWLNNLDLFITAIDNPSLDDLLTVLRAMLAGLPIISKELIGYEDIIYHLKTGLLVEADNSEAVAQNIIKLYQDKRKRRQFAQAAIERVKNHFSLNKTAEQFEKILNQ